ncbi:hypothetical protein AB833_10280 [Chromatiales bacterium (ex Bugula neritina AB1)]|nr:hypothetical protein AB833_10280 [Chromatiales bacterium (ex Bugula neritina AB1)]
MISINKKTCSPIGTAVLVVLFLMLNVSAALAQSSGVCLDSDNDGWGWDGSQSCRIENAGAGSSAQCIDEDGDGWGWDGENSCLATAAGPAAGGSACIDEDGDGWGWNGSASCRIQAAPVNQAPVSQGPGNPPNPGVSGGNGRFNASRDLVALHFDHAPDRDDGHAAAAALAVVRKLGLNVQVVSATYGVWSADRYVPESVSLMNSVWGSNWLDAHNSHSMSVEQATQRWVTTLSAGGDVWIAEGGPSDFTAAVIQNIARQYPEIQTRSRIHLIQHSDWNEDHTLRASLNYVRSNVRYVKIADGNEPNATADFRNFSQSFVDGVTRSQYGSAWRAAFSYLSPYEKLDFSDTVELLHIVGTSLNAVATVDDFAREFIY